MQSQRVKVVGSKESQSIALPYVTSHSCIAMYCQRSIANKLLQELRSVIAYYNPLEVHS